MAGRGGRTRGEWVLGVTMILAAAAIQSVACASPLGEEKTCDSKCQNRAKTGEVVIVSIVLVIALISGLACLSSLGTPSKFHQPSRGRGAAS